MRQSLRCQSVDMRVMSYERLSGVAYGARRRTALVWMKRQVGLSKIFTPVMF